MNDRAVPNLPSRDFDRTIAFYEGFGSRSFFKMPSGWSFIAEISTSSIFHLQI